MWHFPLLVKILLLLEIEHTFNEQMADGQTDIITTSRDSVGAKHIKKNFPEVDLNFKLDSISEPEFSTSIRLREWLGWNSCLYRGKS